MNYSFILYSIHAIILKMQLRRRDVTAQHGRKDECEKDCLTIDSVMRSTSTASSTTSCGQKALQGGNRKKKKTRHKCVCQSLVTYVSL